MAEPKAVSNVIISIQAGTERTVYVKWDWSRTNTDSFDVIWYYYVNSMWFEKQTDSVKAGSPLNSTCDAPANAERMRARIRPIAKSHKVNGKDTPYWVAEWVNSPDYIFDNMAVSTTGPKMVSNIKVALQVNTGRDVYVTWKWSRAYTSSFDIVWYYYIKPNWYEGETQTVKAGSPLNSTYSPKAEAERVKVKICPVAENHKVNGVDTPYWIASWATSDVFKFGGGKVPEVKPIKKIEVDIQHGTDRTMYAKWEWDEEHTDHYDVMWQYTTGDGYWNIEDTVSVNYKQHIYEAKTNANKVKVKVKPISKTHIVKGVETAYWTTDWSEYVIYKLKAEPIPVANKITDITVGIQSLTERTMYAKWECDLDHVESYTYQWSYTTGDGFWFNESESTTDMRQCTYSAPANANKVKIRIRPNSKTHNDHGQETAYWVPVWSDPVIYKLIAEPVPDAGTVQNVAIGIQTGSDRTMYATWEWSQDHTESYSVKWWFETGDGFWYPTNETSTTDKICTYSAPSNATKVKVQIRPNSETHYSNGQTVPYWSSDWCQDTVFSLEAKPMPVADKITNIEVGIQPLTERTMYATWQCGLSNVKSYTYQWLYDAGNGIWFEEGETESVTNQCIYTAPDNACKVKFLVRPNSETHMENGQETAYWLPVWSDPIVYEFVADPVPEAGTVRNVKIGIQGETERTMYAIWDWNEDHTESYSVKWCFETGDGFWWETDETTTTIKQHTYSAPSNARKVKVRIRPNSETHSSNGQTVPYWSSDWCPDTVFSLEAEPIPVADPVSDVTVGIQSMTERTMYAIWECDLDHIESYTYQWSYNTGDGFWFNESESTTEMRQCTYSAPSNANKVKIRIRPNSETHFNNGQQTGYWLPVWSDPVVYEFVADPVPDAGTVQNVKIGIQGGTERTMYATWEWDQDHTESYSIKWCFETGDGFWYETDETTTTIKQHTYSAPSNAYKVKLQIRPNSETHYSNGQTVPYWSSDWSSDLVFVLEAEPVPEVDPVYDLRIGIQSGTDRTMYAAWEWSLEYTESYSVVWSYDTGNGIWFEEDETTVTITQCIYSAPSNAVQIKLRVRANSESHYENGVSVAYWSSEWTADELFTFTNVAEIPSVPSVTIVQYTLTAEVNISDVNTYEVEFQVVKNNAEIFSTGKAKVLMGYASYSCSINVGDKYKVRCRGITSDGEYSDWSDYSESKGTIPATPSSITSCRALTQKSVEIVWTPVLNADSYDVEYTTNKMYFDSSNDVQSMSVESITQRAIVTGLSSGEEWFFRVRATNENGSSGWCSPVSVVLGKVPDAPTTWSQTTTVVVGEDAILYWVHNSEDGSHQSSAEIELTIGGQTSVKTIQFNVSEDEDDEEETSSYTVETGSYSEGTEIQWRVRTKGILDEYSPWSILRVIDVYAPPTLVLHLSDKNKWHWDSFNFETDSIYTAYGDAGEWNDTLNSFPYYITATPGPATQKPVGYYMTITANESYETINQVGEKVWISEGDTVYTNYFDAIINPLTVTLIPSNIDLENGISYSVYCSVYMDSGMTAEASAEFYVEWMEEEYVPDAEIALDKDAVATYIRPYCVDGNGKLIDNVVLSVYRREFDGAYTELAKGIDNSKNSYIIDPHPALDYARYRIVTISKTTGAIGYYDVPGYPVNEISVIIQWDEEWESFEGGDELMEKPAWSGSMLKLPYNIDVSDEHEMDVSFVKYIGRSHPVSYYGTQLGYTSIWNVDIVKGDEETLYQLRRLMRYTGDVYVREPSGSGYWANISVSFSQKHCEMVIPVTLNITRVDGGV